MKRTDKLQQIIRSVSNALHRVVKLDVCLLSLHVSDFTRYLPREEGVGEGPTSSRRISSVVSAHGFKPGVELFKSRMECYMGPLSKW
jgi:hypothetical protein